MDPIRITHFSDVLCVWAYVGQVRIDQLKQTYGGRVDIDQRFCSVFGDTVAKLAKWNDRGGVDGYAAHVREIAARYDTELHADVWRVNAPRSSMACHVFLCAVRELEARGEVAAPGAFVAACWRMRTAFFRELRDIGARAIQLELAEELGLPCARLEACLDGGGAHAALSTDYDLAREQAVTVSPSLILDGGRQRLNGNVSFGVIEANVKELTSSADAHHVRASAC